MQLILASQSPYRRAQLENFGLRFEAVAPRVDETELKRDGPTDLEELTRYLAEAKVRSLIADFSEAILLGSDQLAEIDGERLDKPGAFAQAKRQLEKLRGREHRLITSLAIHHRKRTLLFTDITRITLKKLKDEEIEAYLKLDQPFDCAGSYKIEKAGMALIESLDSKDPSAIQGLPLLSLTKGLEELGVPLRELWRTK